MKEDQIVPPSMKLLTTHKSDDDLIIDHLQGKLERTELSEKVQEQLERMLECEPLIRRHVSRTKVVPMLMKKFEISWSTGARIYDKTQRLFGETALKHQSFWADHVLAGVQDDIELARTAKDFRSLASLRKLQAEIIQKLMGSADAALYERIQLPVIEVSFFPRSMKLDKMPKDKELKSLISDKLKQISEDVEPE